MEIEDIRSPRDCLIRLAHRSDSYQSQSVRGNAFLACRAEELHILRIWRMVK